MAYAPIAMVTTRRTIKQAAKAMPAALAPYMARRAIAPQPTEGCARHHRLCRALWGALVVSIAGIGSLSILPLSVRVGPPLPRRVGPLTET